MWPKVRALFRKIWLLLKGPNDSDDGGGKPMTRIYDWN